MRVHFIQHNDYVAPGIALQWCMEMNHECSFTRLWETSIFPSPDDFDMLIVLGGSMNVDESEIFPWLQSEKIFLRRVIEKEKKIIAICLGAQLIAEILGARVYKAPANEIGFFTVELQKEALRYNHNNNELIACHWHGYRFDLPEGCILLAKGNFTPCQAFSYKNQIFAFQFHPELTPQILEWYIHHGEDELQSCTTIENKVSLIENAVLLEKSNLFLKKILHYTVEQNKKILNL